jgi:tRNA dimethylallyltransferase
MDLITILGPTSSGKSDLAIALAQSLGDAWVVSCDSRQVFKQLDIGTGKVLGDWKFLPEYGVEAYVSESVSHFLIDYVDLNRENIQNYSLIQYIHDFNVLFQQAKKLPKYVILAGGTAWYAKAIYDKVQLTRTQSQYIQNHNNVNTALSKKKLTDLYLIYHLLGSQNTCFDELNESDIQNPARVRNAILRMVSANKEWGEPLPGIPFDRYITTAIIPDINNLKERITQRIHARIEHGLIDELLQIAAQLGPICEDLGLEYRLGHAYFQGKLTHDELIEKCVIENHRYAKRQLTWLAKQDVHQVTNLDDIHDLLA